MCIRDSNLLLRQNNIIDISLDYVTIVLGTEAHKNEILSSLNDKLEPGVVEILELKKLYETTELMKKNFSDKFENVLSECGLLLDLFSKYSSHYNLTTIHITQNVFSRQEGSMLQIK